MSAIDNPPRDPEAGEIVTKTIIGFIVGALIAGLVSVLIIALGSESFLLSAQALLPFLLMTIAFIGTLVGVGMMIAAYHVFFPKVYNDFRTMIGFSFIINTLLFFVFAILYLVVNIQGQLAIYLVLGFHISFGVFLSFCAIEMQINPQYSGSALVGTSIGFALTAMICVITYLSSQGLPDSTRLYYLMLLPPICVFSFVPFVHAIWTKLYYVLYEMGSNFLYLYTVDEIAKIEEQKTQDEVQHEDIHIDTN